MPTEPKMNGLKPKFYLHIDFGIDWIQRQSKAASSSQSQSTTEPMHSHKKGLFSRSRSHTREPESLQRRTRSFDDFYPPSQSSGYEHMAQQCQSQQPLASNFPITPNQPNLLDLSPPRLQPYSALPLTPADLNPCDPLTASYDPDAPSESTNTDSIPMPSAATHWYYQQKRRVGSASGYHKAAERYQNHNQQQHHVSESLRVRRHAPQISKDSRVQDMCPGMLGVASGLISPVSMGDGEDTGSVSPVGTTMGWEERAEYAGYVKQFQHQQEQAGGHQQLQYLQSYRQQEDYADDKEFRMRRAHTYSTGDRFEDIRSPGLRSPEEMMALSSAMVTVDNGFEEQWWNGGSAGIMPRRMDEVQREEVIRYA